MVKTQKNQKPNQNKKPQNFITLNGTISKPRETVYNIWPYYISLYVKGCWKSCVWMSYSAIRQCYPSPYFPTLLNYHFILIRSQLFFYSLCWYISFLFLLHWEDGTNQKLTFISSHHRKYLIPTYLHLCPYIRFFFVLFFFFLGPWMKSLGSGQSLTLCASSTFCLFTRSLPLIYNFRLTFPLKLLFS